MKSLTPKAERGAAGIRVLRIADDGPATCEEVRADLMHTAGQQAAPEQ